MEPERTARPGEEIAWTCPVCGKENRFPLETFDMDAPHRCRGCGNPVFSAEPADEPRS
ncbi:MAG: hypothetical protein K5746_09735 [Clostridiales bacterium]|nr:hypothetical protein [Clostridiales bacterium]